MKKYYKVANLVFTISGNDNGNGYNAIADYFKDKEFEKTEATPMLCIEVAEDDHDEMSFAPECYSLSKIITFNQNTFHVKKNGRSYTVKNLFNKEVPTEVILYAPSPSSYGIKDKLSDMLRSQEVSNHDIKSKFVQSITDYSSMWYIFAVTLMKCGCVFVHSGMMAKDEKGIILSGTGGCGKTSTMMELISNGSGYQYLSEDFGIISSDGILYDMQKKAAIYQSDVKWGNPILVEAIKKLPKSLQREWNWKKKTGKNPVHYFSPKELFGANISPKSCVEKVFYLQRVMKEGPVTSRPIEAEEIAERIKTASFRELKEVYELLCNIRAVGGREYWENYPTIQDLEKWYLSILHPVLKKIRCYELVLPYNVKPNKTAEHILSI